MSLVNNLMPWGHPETSLAAARVLFNGFQWIPHHNYGKLIILCAINSYVQLSEGTPWTIKHDNGHDNFWNSKIHKLVGFPLLRADSQSGNHSTTFTNPTKVYPWYVAFEVILVFWLAQWPFQELKLEEPSLYKACVWRNIREYPVQHMAFFWVITLPPYTSFLGSWNSNHLVNLHIFHGPSTHRSTSPDIQGRGTSAERTSRFAETKRKSVTCVTGKPVSNLHWYADGYLENFWWLKFVTRTDSQFPRSFAMLSSPELTVLQATAAWATQLRPCHWDIRVWSPSNFYVTCQAC